MTDIWGDEVHPDGRKVATGARRKGPLPSLYTVRDITDLYGRQRTAVRQVAEHLDIGEIRKVPGNKGRLHPQLVFTEEEKEKLREYWHE